MPGDDYLDDFLGEKIAFNEEDEGRKKPAFVPPKAPSSAEEDLPAPADVSADQAIGSDSKTLAESNPEQDLRPFQKDPLEPVDGHFSAAEVVRNTLSDLASDPEARSVLKPATYELNKNVEDIQSEAENYQYYVSFKNLDEAAHKSYYNYFEAGKSDKRLEFVRLRITFERLYLANTHFAEYWQNLEKLLKPFLLHKPTRDKANEILREQVELKILLTKQTNTLLELLAEYLQVKDIEVQKGGAALEFETEYMDSMNYTWDGFIAYLKEAHPGAFGTFLPKGAPSQSGGGTPLSSSHGATNAAAGGRTPMIHEGTSTEAELSGAGASPATSPASPAAGGTPGSGTPGADQSAFDMFIQNPVVPDLEESMGKGPAGEEARSAAPRSEPSTAGPESKPMQPATPGPANPAAQSSAPTPKPGAAGQAAGLRYIKPEPELIVGGNLTNPLIGSKEWNNNPLYQLQVAIEDIAADEANLERAFRVSVSKSDVLKKVTATTAQVRTGLGKAKIPEYRELLYQTLLEIRKEILPRDFPEIKDDQRDLFLFHITPNFFWKILQAVLRQGKYGFYSYLNEKKEIVNTFPNAVLKAETVLWWHEFQQTVNPAAVDIYLDYSKIADRIKARWQTDYQIARKKLDAFSQQYATQIKGYNAEQHFIKHRFNFFTPAKVYVYKRFIPKTPFPD